MDILTCEGRRPECSQAGQQIKNRHLDQRVLAIPAFQHPLAHLREEGYGVGRGKGGVEFGRRESGPLATYLVKFFLHQVSATSTLHQSGLSWAGGSPKSHEALVRTVPQQSHQRV